MLHRFLPHSGVDPGFFEGGGGGARKTAVDICNKLRGAQHNHSWDSPSKQVGGHKAITIPPMDPPTPNLNNQHLT